MTDRLFVCFLFPVWWKAGNLWESQATSSAEPPASRQASVCEPGYHGDRVPPALQGAAGSPAVGLLQQLLPGQNSERQVRCWAGHMEVPSGGLSCLHDIWHNIKSVIVVLLYFKLIHFLCLQVNFEDEARVKFLRLLGFSKDELEKKVFCLWLLTVAISWYLWHISTYLCLILCLCCKFFCICSDFKMPGEEFSAQWTWNRCQGSGRKDAAALHWGQPVCTKMFTFKSFWSFLFAYQVLQPSLSVKYPLLYFQRTDEATAVADARTSGSVSPADFFSQTPKENSNFQIPISSGKIPRLQTFLFRYLTSCHCWSWLEM